MSGERLQFMLLFTLLCSFSTVSVSLTSFQEVTERVTWNFLQQHCNSYQVHVFLCNLQIRTQPECQLSPIGNPSEKRLYKEHQTCCQDTRFRLLVRHHLGLLGWLSKLSTFTFLIANFWGLCKLLKRSRRESALQYLTVWGYQHLIPLNKNI